MKSATQANNYTESHKPNLFYLGDRDIGTALYSGPSTPRLTSFATVVSESCTAKPSLGLLWVTEIERQITFYSHHDPFYSVLFCKSSFIFFIL